MRDIVGFLQTVSVAAVTVVTTTLATPVVSVAQDSPPAFAASPDVYKVMAENDNVRVLFAVWKPGQRDAWHSHPQLGVYYLSDCRGRIHLPGGQTVTINRRAGDTAVQKAIQSHAFENTGDTECRLVILERK
jgi:quercetin dioxygenase-like cupin family protein